MAKAKVAPVKREIVKRKPNFVLSKSSKNLLSSTIDSATRKVLKSLLIDAEISYENAEWLVMNYDVNPNGKRPTKKQKE